MIHTAYKLKFSAFYFLLFYGNIDKSFLFLYTRSISKKCRL